MKEYILFLDESKNTPPSTHFSLGGCAIEKEYYEKTVIPYVNQIKKEIWGNENIILHETDIRAAKSDDYKILRNKDIRDKFWKRMGELFDNYEITVFSATIEPHVQQSRYNSKYLNEEYFICLESVLENFAHFLEKNQAQGKVVFECQNTKSDNRVKDHFYRLSKRGTRYLNNTATKQIVSIDSYMKSDLNIGLQVADFIPNTIKKYVNGIDPKLPTIESNIVSKLYDGYIGLPQIFGAVNIK